MSVSFQPGKRVAADRPVISDGNGNRDWAAERVAQSLAQQEIDFDAAQQDNVNFAEARRLSTEQARQTSQLSPQLPFYLRDRGLVPENASPESAENNATTAVGRIHNLKVPPATLQGRMDLQESLSEAHQALEMLSELSEDIGKDTGRLSQKALEVNGRRQELLDLTAVARDLGATVPDVDSTSMSKDVLLAAIEKARLEKAKVS